MRRDDSSFRLDTVGRLKKASDADTTRRVSQPDSITDIVDIAANLSWECLPKTDPGGLRVESISMNDVGGPEKGSGSSVVRLLRQT